MQKITPCLWFEKNCEEAIHFYVDIFKSAPNASGKSEVVMIQRYPENIPNPPWGPGMEGKIITAIFTLAGQQFMALDGGPLFKPSAAISFQIECEDQAEVDHYWEKLGEGGDPNARQCGWLADKYGFSWQVVPKILPKLLTDPDKEKAGRAMQAMLQMKKIEIEKLEKAAKG